MHKINEPARREAKLYSVMIVDDEEIVREGIAELIRSGDCGFYVKGTYGDGASAMKAFEQERADLILTDICMPVMDGIELIGAVRQIDQSSHITIVSGHDDFFYAQAGLRLGAADYLLKPVRPDAILELLAKIRRSLDTDSRIAQDLDQLRVRADRSLPLARERFIQEWIVRPHRNLESTAANLGILCRASLYMAVIVKIGENIGKPDALIRQYVLDLAVSVIREPVWTYACTLSDDTICFVCMCDDHDKNQLFTIMNQYATRFVSDLRRHFGLDAFVATSSVGSDMDKVPILYEEARVALDSFFDRAEGAVMNFGDTGLRSKSTVSDNRKERDEYLLSVITDSRLGNADAAVRSLDRYLECLLSGGTTDPEALKSDALEMVLMIKRAAEEAMDRPVVPKAPYNGILNAGSVREMREILLEYLGAVTRLFADIRSGHKLSTIERAKAIVNARFDDEALTLDRIASELFISTGYLRSLFKQVEGLTFLDYLNRIRMERAGVLLSDESLLIQDIATKVGFGNQRYFAVCFKKYHGMTPSEYRSGSGIETHRRI